MSLDLDYEINTFNSLTYLHTVPKYVICSAFVYFGLRGWKLSAGSLNLKKSETPTEAKIIWRELKLLGGSIYLVIN